MENLSVFKIVRSLLFIIGIHPSGVEIEALCLQIVLLLNKRSVGVTG